MDEIALRDGRVILTRDKKFFGKRFFAPCYMLADAIDTEKQFLEVAKFFHLKPTEFDLLIRCVKCNDLNLARITQQEAQLYLDFKNVFWFNLFCVLE